MIREIWTRWGKELVVYADSDADAIRVLLEVVG